MPKTIANVLTGVATLQIAAPDGSRAEWSTEQFVTGSHSVKLSKLDGGNYGSTGVQFAASGNAAAQTIQDFEDQALAWGWDYWRNGPLGTYWEQMELRFEDPNSESWVDITVQVDVAALGGQVWITKDLADTDQCFFGGWSELDGSFSNWVPANIDAIVTAVDAAAPNQTAVTASGLWKLTRVKIEAWETSTVHYVYVDDVVIDGITYTLEPGDTDTEAILLNAPFTDVGYTEDGVTMTYNADTADIRTDEETFPIDNVITTESVEVTANLAESSLFNMDKAMAGSLLSGSILKLGAGTQKKLTLQIVGTNPAGFTRAIQIPSCIATGSVGMPYKKDEKTVVPVTFRALKTTGHPAVTIVDNAA